MEFKDWRKKPGGKPSNQDASPVRKYYGRRFNDYIDEQIREAEAQGKFNNLQGTGKPLNLDHNPYLGDKAMGYNLLKSNGYAPKEIELAKEIRTTYERAEARLAKYRRQGSTLRSRRVPPFPSERRAYNSAVIKATSEYERTLRDLNRKILTLNLMAPSALHMHMYEVEKLVQRFREDCPLFE